jgi:hypothetical protein
MNSSTWLQIKENVTTRVNTVVNDVLAWHQASSSIRLSDVDDVTPMLMPGEVVLASLPMVGVLGFPKFRVRCAGFVSGLDFCAFEDAILGFTSRLVALA